MNGGKRVVCKSDISELYPPLTPNEKYFRRGLVICVEVDPLSWIRVKSLSPPSSHNTVLNLSGEP
jgi:hypothetical protein